MTDFDSLDESKKIETKVEGESVNYEIIPQYIGPKPDRKVENILGFDVEFDGERII